VEDITQKSKPAIDSSSQSSLHTQTTHYKLELVPYKFAVTKTCYGLGRPKQ